MPRNKQKTNVAAVVVTYNRLALLKRCVGCLRGQTALCDILIVNNASTDGTEEWLAAQADLLSRNTQPGRCRWLQLRNALGGGGRIRLCVGHG